MLSKHSLHTNFFQLSQFCRLIFISFIVDCIKIIGSQKRVMNNSEYSNVCDTLQTDRINLLKNAHYFHRPWLKLARIFLHQIFLELSHCFFVEKMPKMPKMLRNKLSLIIYSIFSFSGKTLTQILKTYSGFCGSSSIFISSDLSS